MESLVKQLEAALADTYALYLKTQNYHWHVTGPHFVSLHQLFERQYKELAEFVDELAERLRILGHKAPATFSEFNELKTIQDGNPTASATQMLNDLAQDRKMMSKRLGLMMESAHDEGDEGSASLLSEQMMSHEKAHWMLSASV